MSVCCQMSKARFLGVFLWLLLQTVFIPSPCELCASAAIIQGLPDVRWDELFKQADMDDSASLNLTEWMKLCSSFFSHYSPYSFHNTDIERNIAPQTFRWCSGNRSSTGTVREQDLLRCTSHHYLYGNWTQNSGLWPPMTRKVARFNPESMSDMSAAMQYFWENGYAVFKALPSNDTRHAQVCFATSLSTRGSYRLALIIVCA